MQACAESREGFILEIWRNASSSPTSLMDALLLQTRQAMFHVCRIKTSCFVYYAVFSVLSQEVLELAFSILYDSNCQLNFIAPDKHEVRSLGKG